MNMFEMLPSLSQAYWERSSEDEKIAQLKKLVTILASFPSQHPPCPIEIDELADEDKIAGFNPETRTVILNRRHISRADECVDSVAHECRHNFQLIVLKSNNCTNDYTQDQVEQMRQEFADYHEIQNDDEKYRVAFIENDANDFAKRILADYYRHFGQ